MASTLKPMIKKRLLILFLLCLGSITCVAEPKEFGLWLRELKDRLKAQEISEVTIEGHLPENIELIPKVIELDRNQPEYKLSFDQYYNICANAKTKRDAIKLFHIHKNKLSEIERKYKVEKKYIVALWAIESHFGKNLGKYPVINSLVTLAHEGRRSQFFEKELVALLKLIDQGKIKSKKVIKGSWAGALGNFQFMPSAYAQYGVDYNGNGQIDLWEELDDAFASAANYLSSNGWQYGKPCMEESIAISESSNLTGQTSDNKRITLIDWQQLIRAGRSGEKDSRERIIVLDPGQKKSEIVAYNNFDVIMKWNKSNHFAAAVSKLANSLQ